MFHRTKLRIWSVFDEADRSMLKTPAAVVDLTFLATKDMQKLIDDMIKTMWQADGVGLAATQIGKSMRLAVIVGEGGGHAEPLILVNPTINVVGTEQNISEEGCLSVPGVFGNVARASHIIVKAFDRHGQAWTKTADDLFARIIQHEIDHLNGVLFIDRTTDFTKGQEKLS